MMIGLDIANYLMLTVLIAVVADAVLLCMMFVIDIGQALLGLLWLGLHHSAIRARDVALEEMAVMMIHLQGAEPPDNPSAEIMRRQFPLPVDRVRTTTTGAYGSLLQQPIFRALLWPLGSVSTAQVVQYFLMR